MGRVLRSMEVPVALAAAAALLGVAGWLLLSGPAPRHSVPTAHVFTALDTDGSGALDAQELDGRDPPGQSWTVHDLNADGRLEARELEVAMEELDPRWLLRL